MRKDTSGHSALFEVETLETQRLSERMNFN